MNRPIKTAAVTSNSTSLLALLGITLLLSTYYIWRYGGLWAETDSATFSVLIRNFIAGGRLEPASGPIYANGYAYQAISAAILALSGLDLTTLQQLIYPLTTALLVLPAWVAYRELTSSSRGALFATGLLFAQPEFLFVVLRSSHEKFTRTLLLLCLFLLVRSFRMRHRLGALATHVALFYIAAYAMIATNNLLANSFIVAVAAALSLGWLLQRGRLGASASQPQLIQRLIYVLLVSLGLVYLFTFYAYQPARSNLIVMQSMGERIAALLLDLEARSTNPYIQVSQSWINLPIYFLISSANWIMLVSSIIIWANQGWRWVIRRAQPDSQVAWLLWLLYTAFALQGAASVLVDISGALAGNLQHRVFPSFAIIAVALIGAALARWQPQRRSRLISAGLAATCGLLIVLSMLKATSEPLLSNKWLFYRPEELVALRWSDTAQRSTEIWTAFDERLTTAYITAYEPLEHRNRMVGFVPRPTTRGFLSSAITELQAARLAQPLPIPPDAMRIYDNGLAQLYRLRPQTPYQR